MSTSLYWRPAPKPTREEELPFALKKALARRLWGHDGSLYGDTRELDARIVPYLEGLVDGGMAEVAAGAYDLIAAIKEHETIEVWIGE